MTTIFHLTKKEFIQTFRDKKMIAIIFIAPILQLILLGYAVTTDIKHISVGIWDNDKSQVTRNIIDRVINCGYFDRKGEVENDRQLEAGFKKGEYDFVLYFPPEFSAKIKRMQKAVFEVIAEGSDSNLTAIGISYLSGIFRLENGAYQKEALNRMVGGLNREVSLPTVSPEIRIKYNPELLSSHYMIPGIICLILTLTTMLLTSMAMTKEKETGTIEQIIVSPIKPYEIIIGKATPFVVIGMIDVFLVLTAGVLLFDIEIKGSIALLLASSVLFVLSTLGIGLFISTISRTQQQAMLTTFLFIFPAMILSGFVFPISNMPEEIQYLTYIIPLRYFLTIIRGIILRGNGFDILWNQMLALLIFGVCIFTLSSLRFKKKLA